MLDGQNYIDGNAIVSGDFFLIVFKIPYFKK